MAGSRRWGGSRPRLAAAPRVRARRLTVAKPNRVREVRDALEPRCVGELAHVAFAGGEQFGGPLETRAAQQVGRGHSQQVAYLSEQLGAVLPHRFGEARDAEIFLAKAR